MTASDFALPAGRRLFLFIRKRARGHYGIHSRLQLAPAFGRSRPLPPSTRKLWEMLSRGTRKNTYGPIGAGEVWVLFDGKQVPVFPQLGISLPMPRLWAELKADQKYFPVSAASILAGVARDAMITRAAKRFAGYGFDRHAGYGTAAHLMRAGF